MITLNIAQCDRMENPNDFGPWKLVSFNRRHRDFVHPDDVGVGEHECTKALQKRLDIGTAWLLGCYQHGNTLWERAEDPSLPSCRWDTCTRAGLLTWERRHGGRMPRGMEKRRNSADEFLRMYTAWCNGEVYDMWLEDGSGVEDSLAWCGTDTEQLQYAVKWVVGALHGRKIGKLAGEYAFILEDQLPAEIFEKGAV